MKFLCDRCKTRYSIGDERVRGKILKIRCKNCANVITVREGMASEPDAAVAEPARTRKATQAIPALDDGVVAAEQAAAARGEPAAASPRAVARDPGTARNLGAAREPVLGASRAAGKEPDTARNLGAAREPAIGASRAAGKEPETVRNLSSARTAAGATAPGAAAAAANRSAARAPVAAQTPASAAQARRGAEPARGQRGAADAARDQSGLARGDSVNALNAAFASAMAEPPPAALEEEWYVSIDGEQAGPFSLAEAQRWVAQQSFEAELHCWSEGFDDWLPVDKVSHFRGLRKRPTAPAAPPPLPRPAGAPVRTVLGARAAPAEGEPRPLFAATMASLERGAPAIAGLGLPAPAVSPARVTPSRGSPVSPSGSGDRAGNAAAGAATSPQQARPEARPEAKIDAKIEAKISDRIEVRAVARRDPGIDARGAAQPARSSTDNPFGAGELGDSQTQLEAPPFEDPPEPRRPAIAGSRTPAREPRPSSSDAAVTAPHLPASSTLPGTGAHAAATAPSDFGSDDDDLHIGEVSRVVKLADITRSSGSADRSAERRAGPAPGSVGRSTGLNPSYRGTGAISSLAAAPPPLDGEPGMSMGPMIRAHRRGLIALLVVAGVMMLAGVAAVVLFVLRNDETTGDNLGRVDDIDTSRPEDPITHRPIGSAGTTIPLPPAPGSRPPRVRPPIAAGSQTVEAPPGNSLGGEEIEEVARKHQDMTQRCYMRAQRGADAILIGDVKKIAVTLTVDRDGNITDLQLSDHAADNLGKCLSTAIRGWKFRQSAGGRFRFSLNFVSG